MSTTVTTAAALLVERGALAADLVVDIISVVADQLDGWAADGLVYGTVQPDRITVLLNVEALVEARLTGFPSPPEVLSPTMLMANARYLAPELLSGNDFTTGADTYSLACTAFELLRGSVSFAGGTVAEMLARASRGVLPAADLPGDLGVVLATALAPDPCDRYESAGAFSAALRRAVCDRHAPG
ncbi:hypothetical protein [Tsukamurella spumae]|uniref:Protein kinase domain-containing protein n=1 Tax=Tsukamurella spumae TaxID=44753 RepID=A0A846X881_9ACTN|nr:hypothetical protein [Tsukamurella spumae]NKY20795.1 hypothetical protein [Tsukamurella spumae]